MGKLSYYLNLHLKAKELGIAVDVFDNQELNVDFSGRAIWNYSGETCLNMEMRHNQKS
jgi:hypothetical protein